MGFVRLDFVEGRSGSAPYPLLGEWYKQSTTRRRYGTHQVAIGLVASEAVNPEGGTVSSEDRSPTELFLEEATPDVLNSKLQSTAPSAWRCRKPPPNKAISSNP